MSLLSKAFMLLLQGIYGGQDFKVYAVPWDTLGEEEGDRSPGPATLLSPGLLSTSERARAEC